MKKHTLAIISAAVVTFSCLFFVSGCKTAPKYNFESDPEVDFAAYKTFAVMPLPSQIPGAEPDLILHIGDTLKLTIEDILKTKGYTQVDPDSADFTVNVTGKVVPKVDIRNLGYNPYYTYSSTWRWGYHNPYATSFNNTYVDEYEEGTLIIEIYDTSTKKLVWVGWTSARCDTKEPNLGSVAKKVCGVMNTFPAVP